MTAPAYCCVLVGGIVSFPKLAFMTAGLTVGVLLVWLYTLPRKRRESRLNTSHPQKLLGELCRAHRLSASQRRLLEWVVGELHVPQPALVFLDPSLLEAAVPRTATPAVRKRLLDLQSQLFAATKKETAAEFSQRSF